jgi:hypothetical protein
VEPRVSGRAIRHRVADLSCGRVRHFEEAIGGRDRGPGQRDLVRLVDVDGELFIIDVMTWPELPPGEHEEIHELLDSMTFELRS